MAEIIRNRTIRPSTRLEGSKSYKINTKSVNRDDILIVNINHESKSFRKTFKFKGVDVAHKDSISFRVADYGTLIDINWSGATPIETGSVVQRTNIQHSNSSAKANYVPSNTKTSFEPISNSETTVLILGTMPGDKSIELGEYYGHPRNRFWKIISKITNNDIPTTYFEKKGLLLKTGIGIWDVAFKANRKGSLDSAILDEEPNDLDTFIQKHRNLKAIGFNGTKSQTLFDKYFNRKIGIKYLSLPSSSPANTSIDFAMICSKWEEIIKSLK